MGVWGGWVVGGAVRTALKGYLEHAAELDRVDVNPKVYQRMAKVVAERVQARLLLEDLRRVPGLASAEYYRLFLASQQAPAFPSVPAIVGSVVTFGDVMPDWRLRDLHPLTLGVLKAVWAASEEPLARLPGTPTQELVPLGTNWTQSICRCLQPFLPLPAVVPPRATPEMLAGLPQELRDRLQQRFAAPEDQPRQPPVDQVAPLGERRPPALFDSQNTSEALTSAAAPQLRDPEGAGGAGGQPEPGSPEALSQELLRELGELAKAVDAAGGQRGGWEDTRSDVVTQRLRVAPLGEGPMEGSATDGRVVTVPLGDKDTHRGEIFDRVLPLADDPVAYQALLAETAPVTRALRHNIYPSVSQVPKRQRLCAAGSLDPGRLHLAGISDVVFRRHPVDERADERGHPVLVVACDASGSLSEEEMRMAKLLSAGWMLSTVGRRVQVLAALYHSGAAREGLTGKLVQWMYHPRKTPALGRRDALRGLLSLPSKGTGAQADALSVTFLVEEAEQLARGASIYLTLISDTRWNRCMGGRRDGRREMLDCLAALRKRMGDQLHVTLVALHSSGLAGFRKVVDELIRVPRHELKDPPAVAARVGGYVSRCMRQRRRLLRRA